LARRSTDPARINIAHGEKNGNKISVTTNKSALVLHKPNAHGEKIRKKTDVSILTNEKRRKPVLIIDPYPEPAPFL
jgi:hypothetical protein